MWAGDWLTTFEYATRVCLLKTGDNVEQGSLAASRRTDQKRDLAVVERHVNAGERYGFTLFRTNVSLPELLAFYNWVPDSSCAHTNFLLWR